VVEHLQFYDIRSGESIPKDHVVKLGIERRLTEGAVVAEVVLHFAIRPKGEEQSAFYLEVDLAGRFEQEAATQNMALEPFLKVNGPALLVPFLREVVANITFRSRHGVMLLPAINVAALVQRDEGVPKE